jgi:hypothetical protein
LLRLGKQRRKPPLVMNKKKVKRALKQLLQRPRLKKRKRRMR